MNISQFRRNLEARLLKPGRPQRRRNAVGNALGLERLEDRRLLAGDSVVSFAQLDVNHDNRLTNLDALLVINELNTHGAHAVAGTSSLSASNLSTSSTLRTANQIAGNSPSLDVNNDGYISPLDALLVVKQLNDLAEAQASIVLKIVDPVTKAPISNILQGQQFELQAFVQDVRSSASQPGIAAAYTDVTFDQTLASAVGGVVHSGAGESYQYTNSLSGAITPGLIDEAGGFQTASSPLGAGQQLLFTVILTATGSGTVTFQADPADNLPQDDTLTFDPPASVPTTDINYGAASLTITSVPSVTFTQPTVSVPEGNAGQTAVPITLHLNSPSDGNVSVTYQTVDGTAVSTGANPDFQAISPTIVTFPLNATDVTFNVMVNGDLLDEPDEQFTIQLSSPVGAVVGGGGTSTVTITNDDASPTVGIGDTSITEGTGAGATNMTFNVTLSAASGKTITVPFQIQPGTATVVDDYLLPSAQSVTFLPGETSKPITVPIIRDALNESNETILANLGTPTNATLGVAQATGTIIDDDAQPVLSIAPASAMEPATGTSDMVFTVTLSAVSGQDVTVHYATAASGGANAATPDSDFESTAGILFIPKGSISGTITVHVKADAELEQSETFLLNLTVPTNAALGTAQAVGTIVDFAGNKLVQIQLIATDLNGVPISSAVGGQLFQLRGYVQDLREDPMGVFGAYLDAQFDPALINVLGQITYGTDYPNGHAGTIEPNQLDEVGGLGDLNPLGGGQKLLFTATVQGKAAGTVVFHPDPADLVQNFEHSTLLYNGGAVTNDQIQFLDSAPVQITAPALVNITSQTVTEGNNGTKNMTFTVALDQQVSLPVSVNFGTVDGTATAGSDYVARSGILTFDAEHPSPQTITVQINGDTLNEADETFTLKLTGAVNAIVGNGNGLGTILNDDAAPTISIQNASAVEGLSNAVFNVNLSAPSGQTITVVYGTQSQTATSGLDYTNTAGMLTFLPGETSKAITVPVALDNVVEGSETFLMLLTNPTVASLANSQAVGTITELSVGSISGYVFYDANGDGLRTGDAGLGSVLITLVGTDVYGRAVNRTATTTDAGLYSFGGVSQGTYTITESQPAHRNQGIDTVGTQGGTLTAVDTFTVFLGAGINGVENNFGEGKFDYVLSWRDFV